MASIAVYFNLFYRKATTLVRINKKRLHWAVKTVAKSENSAEGEDIPQLLRVIFLEVRRSRNGSGWFRTVC